MSAAKNKGYLRKGACVVEEQSVMELRRQAKASRNRCDREISSQVDGAAKQQTLRPTEKLCNYLRKFRHHSHPFEAKMVVRASGRTVRGGGERARRSGQWRGERKGNDEVVACASEEKVLGGEQDARRGEWWSGALA